VGLKLQKLAGFMQQDDVEHGYDYLLSYWHDPGQLLNAYTGRTKNNTEAFPETEDFINRVMYLDQVAYLPGDNLAKVDRASMAVSLETRLPLLSHEIVDLSWRLPVSMKVKNNVSKQALRQVLYQYVPHELIDRPKMGFSVPIDQWLRGDLKEWAHDLLGTMNSSGKGILMEKPVWQAWNEHINGLRDHSHRLWTVLMFLSWAHSRS
jgi:asparagine synthase (glutamine-hydrolysing)